MARFSISALLLLLTELGLLGYFADAGLRAIAQGRLGLAGTVHLPLNLGVWLLEAFGLLALYALARGRCLTRWFDGLVAGWLAWVFRGPIVTLTLAGIPGQPREAWLRVSLAWWLIYTICGLSLAWLDGKLDGSHGATENVSGTELE